MSVGRSGPTGARPGVVGLGRGRTDAAGDRSVSALIDAFFPDATAPSGGAVSPADVQSLLAGAVRDLARRTGTTRVCAWLAREGEAPIVVAAHWPGGGDPPTLDRFAFDALAGLRRPTDLGERRLPSAAAQLAADASLAAAIAAVPEDADPGDPAPVVLALGGPDDPVGRVRPRTLAMLDEVALGLRGPLATSLALLRIARLDEAVRALDRRAALGGLVAEIVHEIRNPLVSVKTFLQLLPSRLDDPEFLDEFRPVVVDEVGRLERLLDSVLQHARPSRDDETRAVAGVAEVFEAIVRLLDHRASERRIALRHYVDPGVGDVATPRDALRQVVLNLALNALDATPAGGEVRLAAHAQAVADGRWVEIVVEDDGPGIAPDERRRVFEAFRSTRTDRPGGLGLAISRRLVEDAGGSIRIGEATGGGARITLRLRAAPRL